MGKSWRQCPNEWGECPYNEVPWHSLALCHVSTPWEVCPPEEGPPLTLPAPHSQTSRLQDCGKCISVVYKPPSVWYFVTAAGRAWDCPQGATLATRHRWGLCKCIVLLVPLIMLSIWPDFFSFEDAYFYGTEYKMDSAWSKVVTQGWVWGCWVWSRLDKAASPQHMSSSGICFVIHFSSVKLCALVQTSWEICREKKKDNPGRGKGTVCSTQKSE